MSPHTSYATKCRTFLQVIDSPDPLRNLAELIAAQIDYHKKAYEVLSELAPMVDDLQTTQEASRS